MSNIKDDFYKFLNDDLEREKHLSSEIKKALLILKLALPFLETWYANSHASLGVGCLNVINQIKQMLKDYENLDN